VKDVIISEDIVPIGEFKAHAAQWVKRMKATGQPLIITQNGKPAVVMISPEDYDRVLEKERFFTSIATGLADVESGNTYSTEELKKFFELS